MARKKSNIFADKLIYEVQLKAAALNVVSAVMSVTSQQHFCALKSNMCEGESNSLSVVAEQDVCTSCEGLG